MTFFGRDGFFGAFLTGFHRDLWELFKNTLDRWKHRFLLRMNLLLIFFQIQPISGHFCNGCFLIIMEQIFLIIVILCKAIMSLNESMQIKALTVRTILFP